MCDCESCKNKKDCANEVEISLEEFLRVAKKFGWSEKRCFEYENENETEISNEEIERWMKLAKSYYRKPEIRKAVQINIPFRIKSPEGLLTGKKGDYIICGINGEYYICDQEIFKKTYDVFGGTTE